MLMMMMLDYVNLLVEFVIMSVSILFPTRIITSFSFQAIMYLLVVEVTDVYIYIYIYILVQFVCHAVILLCTPVALS